MLDERRIDAKVTHRFAASAAQVYDAWLDLGAIRQWMPAALKMRSLPGTLVEAELDPRVGGYFRFSDRRADGVFSHWGRYLCLHRPHKIAFTWITDAAQEADPTEITIVIMPADPGCVVTLSQQMAVEWADQRPEIERSWLNMLMAIDAYLLPGIE